MNRMWTKTTACSCRRPVWTKSWTRREAGLGAQAQPLLGMKRYLFIRYTPNQKGFYATWIQVERSTLLWQMAARSDSSKNNSKYVYLISSSCETRTPESKRSWWVVLKTKFKQYNTTTASQWVFRKERLGWFGSEKKNSAKPDWERPAVSRRRTHTVNAHRRNARYFWDEVAIFHLGIWTLRWGRCFPPGDMYTESGERRSKTPWKTSWSN